MARFSARVTALILILQVSPLAGMARAEARQDAAAQAADYCAVDSAGTRVEIVRPAATDPPIDDVNWFARPVPNPRGDWIIGFASHNENYLYNLTTGDRIRIPDASDAVATPDGRYMTVPSHYTSTHTVNFYDLPTLLARLDAGEDASTLAPAFAHDDPDVFDVYYQSTGVVSHVVEEGGVSTTHYRLMFSGGQHDPPPVFRIVDYAFHRAGDRLTVTPSRAMTLCPQIVNDLSTPFISKDGRYVVAHDGDPDARASLKIFEITGLDPASQTTSCELRVDFGFAAGKADFSFDNRQLTFHISKHDYLTPFVNGGIAAPAITDVVVVDLTLDADGAITGHGGLSRVTTSRTEGVGSYFPAFMPDGRLFYISNAEPKGSEAAKRFSFTIVDPDAERRLANVFADGELRRAADMIGRLWRRTCEADLAPFKAGEAPWSFMSLSADQCRRLVDEHWDGATHRQDQMLAACGQLTGATDPAGGQ